MKKIIAEYVAQCDVCQQHKGETVANPGKLQPLPIPDSVWTDISMDFIEGLPSSKGKSTILVVVDRLTKYAHFCAVRNPYTTASIAQIFIENIVKLHGMPRSIVSDRDRIFTSKFWTELFQLQGTKLKMSTAYHPQTDGQTEVVNRCLETYLRCFASDRPKEWAKWLPWAEWWYNTTYHSSTKCAPYEALYGRPAPVIPKYVIGSAKVDQVDQELIDRDKLLQLLKDNLSTAQARMKQQADTRRSEREFSVGDWVYLRLQPYKQLSINTRASMKLSPRFYGPYQITERIGAVAYRLKLPEDAKIHPVFHISCLKPKLGEHESPQIQLPNTTEDGVIQAQPQAILDRKIVMHRRHPSTEVLVHWNNLPLEDATWEPYEELKTRFPEFMESQP